MEWNPLDVQVLHDHWQDVIKATEAVSREAAALLFVARPTCVVAGPIVLVYLHTKYAFHQNRMMSSTLRPAIEIALARIFGKPVAIDVLLEGATTTPPKTPSTPRSTRTRARPRAGNVRAIPTTYAGIQFRSKLEANSAQLFDTVGLRWQYEVEGYDLDGLWYLPDFWLPDIRTFVEVKGILDSKSEEKVERLGEACALRGVNVVLLRDLRMRPVESYLTVIGDWVAARGIETDMALMVRCPKCGNAAWLRRGQTRCPRCQYDVRVTHQFVRVY